MGNRAGFGVKSSERGEGEAGGFKKVGRGISTSDRVCNMIRFKMLLISLLSRKQNEDLFKSTRAVAAVKNGVVEKYFLSSNMESEREVLVLFWLMCLLLVFVWPKGLPLLDATYEQTSTIF